MPSLINGISYVRLSAPDLGRMKAFLEDFGMVEAHRDPKRLYMRGVGEAPFLHVTELGDPGAISFAYELRDPAALTDVAQLPGASAIESLDSPGGGKRVRIRDPHGFSLELVSGRDNAPALPPRPMLRGADGASRVLGPARIVRIAHTAYAT